MQNERSRIKWLPFNSVCDSKEMIRSINKERSKVKKPKLSDEQINLIEEELIKAFYEDIKVKVYYYKSGFIFNMKDKIKKIDSVYHKIYFESGMLLFDQIISVSHI